MLKKQLSGSRFAKSDPSLNKLGLTTFKHRIFSSSPFSPPPSPSCNQTNEQTAWSVRTAGSRSRCCPCRRSGRTTTTSSDRMRRLSMRQACLLLPLFQCSFSCTGTHSERRILCRLLRGPVLSNILPLGSELAHTMENAKNTKISDVMSCEEGITLSVMLWLEVVFPSAGGNA